ncbi:hypothetical protein TPL01_31160 [Sulfuriferula plumbiphila]|uniref:Putative zinc-finger domain-containing protein n=1 Tax=Sulfuriferula plumbiphila TaxID=171865 RepID=A0A512LBV9_9PROT|nr:zf-HC2 domain-containing protein [Sulfuriferula plumbiphila]BBP05416.1 hypothetical protein SFPGR_28380 [Sulfuriferula plumbiphila]GEP31978.1 hypothetical protein TPL01_31160 [Sulfuriferula plumbiphila]
MLNCQEVTRLVSESQERSLTLREKMSLRTHVMMCSGCRNYEKNMMSLRLTARAFAKGADERVKK